MKKINIVKHEHAICFKYGGRFLTSLTMPWFEEKASICSGIKQNLILYYRKFSEFVASVIN